MSDKLHAQAPLPPEQRGPGTSGMGGLDELEGGFGHFGKIKILSLLEIRNRNSWTSGRNL